MATILPPTPQNIARAAETLRAGGLVAMPTETVYGLAADATQPAAVARVFAAKGRPSTHPLIVHLSDLDQVHTWAINLSNVAQAFMRAFWPGPLTVIVRRHPNTLTAVTGGLDTVALRVPKHPVALGLIRALGTGVAAPSANRFGGVSPTTAAHVAQSLGDAVDLILDGGPCDVGVESTIVDVSQVDPEAGVAAVLRPGGVSLAELSRVAGQPVFERRSETVRAPGQLESHYAPEAPVRLVPPRELVSEAATLAAQGLRVAVLTEDTQADWPPGVVAIALPSDPARAAQRLYAALREVDERGCHVALTTLPLPEGLGLAVADRLRKAAGPRP
ncbi:MAG: L-threonylcarbamoyladenylate synthase [Deltaproteobacteria bacterium]|nr:L-threonylcarbamoyladenylate synthase [Deltaproteobacteria bacterium]